MSALEPAADELDTEVPLELGGESACLAPLVCSECGAVAGDGPHRPECPLTPVSK